LHSSATLSTVKGSPEQPVEGRVPANPWPRALLWIAMVAAAVAITGFFLKLATERFDFSEPKLNESLDFSNTQLDVAFFGDSLTLEGVNPSAIDQQLRTRSYNFALGGASILESEMQLRLFLRHNPKPRLVALGIYVNVPNKPAGVRPTLYFSLPDDLKAKYRAELWSYEGIKIDRSFLVFNRIPAYRYRNSIDLVLKSLVSHEDQRPVFAQGQAQVTFFREPYLGGQHESVFRPDELKSFIEFCEQERIPLLLFEPPNHPGYAELTSNRARILNDVSTLVRQHPGTRFVAYDGADFARKDWVNLNHLNKAGSVKLSTMLSNALVEGMSR